MHKKRLIGVVALVVSAVFGLTAMAASPTVAEVPTSTDPLVVHLAQQGDDPDVLTMDIKSAALGTTITNTVFLPKDYDPAGPALPVVYYLHGTIVPYINYPALRPAVASDWELNALGPDGGRVQTNLEDFPATAASAHYIVVAPDTAENKTVCDICMWMNGRNGKGLMAEDYLYKELIPAVQSTFHTRTDRAGRGILGFSMGGWGALLNAFRHPDEFGVVGGISPVFDSTDPLLAAAFFEPFGYFRAQGGGLLLTDRISWANFSPVQIASNVAGSQQQMMISNGDGCVSVQSLRSALCKAHSPLLNPLFTTAEILLSRDVRANTASFEKQGAGFRYVTTTGIHGADNAQVYKDDYVPFFNKAFDRSHLDDPSTFTYRTADDSFDVWGYHVSVDRPNREFLSLDQRSPGMFSLTGSGVAEVRTPAIFTPSQSYDVVSTDGSGASRTVRVKADDQGRIEASITVGPVNRVDQYSPLQALNGAFHESTVEVSIRPAP